MHESSELGYLHQLGQDATHVAQDDFTTLPIDPHCSPYKRAEAKAGCEIEAVTVEDDLSGAVIKVFLNTLNQIVGRISIQLPQQLQNKNVINTVRLICFEIDHSNA